MELDFFRILATFINIAILVGIIVLIFKFIKGLFGLNKRIIKMEKDIEEIKNELKNR